MESRGSSPGGDHQLLPNPQEWRLTSHSTGTLAGCGGGTGGVEGSPWTTLAARGEQLWSKEWPPCCGDLTPQVQRLRALGLWESNTFMAGASGAYTDDECNTLSPATGTVWAMNKEDSVTSLGLALKFSSVSDQTEPKSAATLTPQVLLLLCQMVSSSPK